MIDIKERDLSKALMTLILDSLNNIEDIDTVCNYQFDTQLITGNRLKGVVKVVFEEVD